MLGDALLYRSPELKTKIDNRTWLGRKLPSLFIGRCEVRRYIIGDCAFVLLPNLMKTVINEQVKNKTDLELWNRIAHKIRNPIECVYSILKGRI